MPTRRLVVARLLATYAVALTPGLRPRQPPRGATRLASTPTTDAWYLFRSDLAVAPVPVPRSTQFVTGGAPTMARAASTTSQAALRLCRNQPVS